MTETQYLLQCLQEECDEVGQRCSKAIRFTLGEVQPGQNLTNAQRIDEEMTDLVGVLELLHDRGLLSNQFDLAKIQAKKDKVMRYMAYSRERGTLEPDNRQCQRCGKCNSPLLDDGYNCSNGACH